MHENLLAFLNDSKNVSISPKFITYLDYFMQTHTETDRSVVVVSGAYLDELLTDLLKTQFVDDEKAINDLINPGKAMSELGQKNKIAYLLGLYDINIQREIRDISIIRNDFAHSLSYDAFSYEKAHSKIMSLRLLRKLANDGDGTPIDSPKYGELIRVNMAAAKDDGTLNDPKELFIRTVWIIIGALQQLTSTANRPAVRRATLSPMQSIGR